MCLSQALLNDKGSVIQRNRCHLIKMGSKFFKIENDNEMYHEIGTKPKRRHTISTTELGEVDEPRENTTELP